ncbi:type IV conjugative transfer system protein TraE [Burkholderia glumae]|uniref:type IV conjugative transfer system protein TraE n=1 Tax=Burkholderia glumae TaxID=337 RepID=UPI00203705EC|nr:type IV conjugative transfer system protein TraE [Burkholderia glumae]MCM2547543.1 type IV conjugative transfer system protein TraE [Burkholderia glumae]
MTPENAKKTRDALQAENRFLKKALLGNGAGSVIVALICGWLMLTQRIVIMPPAVRGTYIIGAQYANAAYLADQALYVLSLAKSVTPQTVDNNIRILLSMASDDERADLKTLWDANALQLKHDGVTTVFQPTGSGEVDMTHLAVKVSGTEETYISGKRTNSQQKTYLVYFHISIFGRLTLVDIREALRGKNGIEPLVPTEQPAS